MSNASKMTVAIAAAASAELLLLVPALAATTNWNHNGSTITWDSDGNRRVARYAVPRPGMKGLVKSGTVLFEGFRRGNTLTGMAYVFKSGCKPAGYSVTAEISSEREFVLKGAAPVFESGAGCRIERYEPTNRNASLRFTFIDPNTSDPNISVAADDKRSSEELEREAIMMEGDSEEKAQVQADLEEQQHRMNYAGQNRYLKWTKSGSHSQAELAYDTCSRMWNDNRFFEKFNPKFLVAGTTETSDGYTGRCFSTNSTVAQIDPGDWDRARERVMKSCRAAHKSCHVFATGNTISDWALEQEASIANGSRFARNNNNSGGGGGGGGDSDGGGGSDAGAFLNDLLGLATSAIQGYNAGRSIGNAMNGSSGRSGGSGGSVNLPRGNGYSQKGSFDDCAALYRSVGRNDLAAQCGQGAAGLRSLR